MRLQDQTLLRSSVYVNGQWIAADSGQTLVVRDPASGAQLATVPACGATETERAVAATEAALPAWRDKTAKQRAQILQRWFATLRPNERGEMVGDWLSRRAAEKANWTQDQHAAAVGLLSRAGIVVQRGNFYRVVDAYRDLPSALHQLDAYYAPRVREAPLPQRASYVESDDD